MSEHERNWWGWICLVLVFTIVVLIMCLVSTKSRAAEWVVDDAKILTQAEKQMLSYRAAQLQEKTQATIVIHTTPTSGVLDIRDYGIKFARTQKIGNKENKGIVIVIAMAEHKWAIEVGYGLEGIITDYQAHILGSEYLAPYLAKGQFYNAFANTLNKLAVRLETEKE